MAEISYQLITTLNVCKWIKFSNQRHRMAECIKKIKIQWYVAYKRLILALMTHLGWMWRSGKEYSKQMVTKEGNDSYTFIRQNN